MESDSIDPSCTSEPQTEFGAAWQIVDANLNRATEALRVIEDTFRFVLGDSHLCLQCKQLRHRVTGIIDRLTGKAGLIAARDAAADIGRTSLVDDEYRRTGIDQILQANFSRAGQSVRVLEEYCKLVDRAAAVACESVRFQIYELEKATLAVATGRRRLDQVRLCVLVDGCENEPAFVNALQVLIAGGVDMVQLRDKTLEDRHLISRARALVDLTRPPGIISIINDRVDIAVLCDADGAHIGQDDLAFRDARRIGGPRLLIGVSTHNMTQVRQAVIDGADYLGAGPTFPSSTKSFDEFPGLAFLESVAEETSLPVFAIGGIDSDNLDHVLSAGICRVAVAGSVFHAGSPDETAIAAMAKHLKNANESDPSAQNV